LRLSRNTLSQRDSNQTASGVAGAVHYPAFLAELKERIAAARIRAALSVNRELVILYYEIGSGILAKVKEGWGTSVIDRLSKDLRAFFPDQTGFSPRNLAYMRQFAETYDEQFLQQAVAKLPWGHNVRILDYVKGKAAREWYVRQTFEQGWSRNVLVFQIDGKLYERQGKASSNFSRTLPEPQSDLAQQLTKDRYQFDFLALTEPFKERKLQCALLENILGLILELGKGFAFLGSDYHLKVSNQRLLPRPLILSREAALLRSGRAEARRL